MSRYDSHSGASGSTDPTQVAIPLSTYQDFVASAVAGLRESVRRLGDDLINQTPPLPDANSPFAIVAHCCGVMEWWGGQVIAGRPVSRDRDAEFRATGTVAEAEALLEAHQQQLSEDLRSLEPDQEPRGDARYGRRQPTQGHAAVHLYEELAQHRGHLDLTRDLLLHPP